LAALKCDIPTQIHLLKVVDIRAYLKGKDTLIDHICLIDAYKRKFDILPDVDTLRRSKRCAIHAFVRSFDCAGGRTAVSIDIVPIVTLKVEELTISTYFSTILLI
jgi:hypothetical protein